MKKVLLIFIFSTFPLFNSIASAIGVDRAQIQISIVIKEQAKNHNCGFDNVSISGLNIGSTSNRSCEINFQKMSQEINRLISHTVFLKSQQINENNTVTVEVTVQ